MAATRTTIINKPRTANQKIGVRFPLDVKIPDLAINMTALRQIKKFDSTSSQPARQPTNNATPPVRKRAKIKIHKNSISIVVLNNILEFFKKPNNISTYE